jgi:hypothetical protein
MEHIVTLRILGQRAIVHIPGLYELMPVQFAYIVVVGFAQHRRDRETVNGETGYKVSAGSIDCTLDLPRSYYF